jgi:hypothetical protein
MRRPGFWPGLLFFLSTSILVSRWGDVCQLSFGWKCLIRSGLRVVVQVLGLDKNFGTAGFWVDG